MNREERRAWLSQWDWENDDRVIYSYKNYIFTEFPEIFIDSCAKIDIPHKLLRLVDGEIVEVAKKLRTAYCNKCQTGWLTEFHQCCPECLKKPKPRVYLCNVCGKPICSERLPHTCLNPTYQEHPLWRYFNWTDWRSDREAGMVVLKAARDWVRDQILAGKL